jgi:hypothetical protein
MPLMLDSGGLDAIAQAVKAEVMAMEREGLVIDNPLLTNIRTVARIRQAVEHAMGLG